MQANTTEVTEKIHALMNTLGAHKVDCKAYGANFDWGQAECYLSEQSRDEVVDRIMSAVDGYVSTAAWTDDYGAWHVAYPMKADKAHKIGFSVAHLGPNKEDFKDFKGIDRIKTTILFTPPTDK